MTNYIKFEGINFGNKGSALMLTSVYNYLKKKNPDIKFLVGKPGFTDFKQYGGKEFLLYREESISRLGIHLSNFLPKKNLEYRGLLRDIDVDLILNLCGYDFGDPWVGAYTKENNKELEKYYKRYKKNRVQIIFLPQAYGPFKKELAKDRITRIADYIDLFYVRDKSSYSYLNEFIPSNKLLLSPDFTSVQDGILLKNDYLIAKDSIIIIPNNKMNTHSNSSNMSDYLDFLIKLIDKLTKLKHKVVLLNHEDSEDRNLIEIVKREVSAPIPVFDNKSALELKGIIGAAKVVISSRYHGVINALNQGIPTFLTSWNHKYVDLFEEYSLKNLILDIGNSNIDTQIDKIINLLRDQDSYATICDRINKTSIGNKEKTEEMFGEILKYLY